MKLYATLNMHFNLKTGFASDDNILLRMRSFMNEGSADIDEQVLEFSVSTDLFPLPEGWDHVHPDKNLLDKPGLYGWARGGRWNGKTENKPEDWDMFIYKGPASGLRSFQVVSLPGLVTDPMIPRSTVVYQLTEEAQNDPQWWTHASLVSMIEKLQPAWGAKGYPIERLGQTAVRVDYVPVTVNKHALKSVLEALMTVGSKLDNLVTDHGSDQGIDSLLG